MVKFPIDGFSKWIFFFTVDSFIFVTKYHFSCQKSAKFIASFTLHRFTFVRRKQCRHLLHLRQQKKRGCIDHFVTTSLIIIIPAFWLFYENHGLRTPNEGINQRYLKNWADVADKICCRHTKIFGSGSEFSAVQ